MVFRPDHTVDQTKDLHASADQYRAHAQSLRDLIEFMRAGGNWDQLDPADAQRHRRTMQSLQRAQAAEYSELSLAQAADALIQRFEQKAVRAAADEEANRPPAELDTVRVPEKPAPVHEPRQINERVRLPGLGNKEWDIVYVDERSRTYVLADPYDRRSPSDIVSDARSGRQGRYAVHQISWDQFEELAKRAA